MECLPFPIPKAGGPDTAHQYVVSALGAKGMELDANGNEWVVVYHTGGDNLGEALIGDLTAPNAQYKALRLTLRPPSWTMPCLVLRLQPWPLRPQIRSSALRPAQRAQRFRPVSPLRFPASSYPATITFTATKPAIQTGTLTVSDTTNGGVGTATVTGFSLTTPQALTFTAPTTTTSTFSPGETITVTVSNGGSNNPAAFTVDSTSTGKGTFSATTVTGTSSVGNADRYTGRQYCHRRQRTGRSRRRRLLRRCAPGPVDAHYQQVRGGDHLYAANLAADVYSLG